MVGAIAGMTATGLYSVANKLVNLISRVVASLRTVMLPRLSFSVGDGKSKDFDNLNRDSVSVMVIILLPVCIGMLLLGRQGIQLLFGKEYTAACYDLRILSIALFVGSLNGFITGQIFLPLRHEKGALLATCFGAIVNLIADCMLIPIHGDKGAAIGTVVAETAVLAICGIYAYVNKIKLAYLHDVGVCVLQSFLASIAMGGVILLLMSATTSNLIAVLSGVPIGAGVYFICLYGQGNQYVRSWTESISHKGSNNR